MSHTRVYQSGRYIEFYTYEKEPRQPENAFQGHKRRSPRRSLSVHRSEANLRRTRQAFIRLVQANLVGDRSPAFFTFTMLDVCSIAAAYRQFSDFIERLRRVRGSEFRYVAVPEFQKRGAVHFHVLIWGLNDEDIASERYTRRIQNLWARGFVDCIPTDGGLPLAGYLGKYMFKAMHDVRLCSKKAYCGSRNLMHSVLVKTPSNLDYLREAWCIDERTGEIGDNVLVKEKSFSTLWLGRCDYKAYRLVI